RFVVASREVAAGELILQATAFAAAVTPLARKMICICCLGKLSEKTRLCDGCGHAFCSEECAEADRPLHEVECAVRRRLRGANFNDFTLTLTALAARALARGSFVADDNNNKKEVLDLCCHRGSAPLQLVSDFRAAERVAKRAAPQLAEQDFVGLMLRCFSNGFSRRDAEGETALLLAPAAAYFNHSCAPNACRDSSEGLQLQFWALETISAGLPVHISYVDLPCDPAEPN
ncbi:unnamed protein product, partial [Polarella glacialis]